MAESIRQHARRLFMEVGGLSEAERGAALDRACAGNAALRIEVEALLRGNAETEGFAELPTADGGEVASAEEATAVAPIHEGPGTRIGPYKLLQSIGEGGFGSVFMAEQEKPVQRKVALKVIKLGMDTRQVVARFEQERQALALLDHPNIAKVLDAGATETGRPFFVMELVKGDPIDAYCDKNNLSIEDRLELFAQVCNAVQHAHTKGIIHRDIKPSNILVSTHDGRPHAKVIDFGIAKATASKLTEKTLFTEHRQLIGTPEYMSPEQAEGDLDIDTRTDVYSLGALLYKLLTGTTPFSSRELRSAAFAEIQRIIREVEPPKPSTRISSNAGSIASVAAHRRTEPKRLGTIVRGELDWIVMKAMEKDRLRRYETASGLGMDVKRYLSGEAVVAAPPSRSYRFKKFIRRNKGPVAAGFLVSMALVLGLIGTSVGLIRAERARAGEAAQRVLADAARAEAVAQETKAREQEAEAIRQAAQARAQEAEAKKQAEIAEAVAKFQTDMLAAVDPNALPKDPATGEPMKDAVTVLQALQAAVKVLDEGNLKDQPLVEANVRDTIGSTLFELSRYDEAEPNLRRSLEIRRAALPTGHPDIARSLNNLAMLLRNQNKLSEAEPLSREALEIRRATLPAGQQEFARSLNNLALLLRLQNRLTEAEPLFRETLEIRRAALPAGHPDIASSLNNLASLLRLQNKLSEAEPLFREALEIHRAAYPAGHPEIATSLNNLALLLRAQGRFAEAEPLFREALEIFRAALPVGHPSIATSLNNLAMLLRAKNEFAEAELLCREALEIRRAALPAAHPDIATGLRNLASLLRLQNKLAEAETLSREALEIARAACPAGHPDIATSLTNLALVLQEEDKSAEAEAAYREALEIFRAALPVGHPDIATCLSSLALVLLDQNKPDEAESLHREALGIYRAALPAGHPSIVACLSNLARLWQQLGQGEKAREALDEAIAMQRQSSPNGTPRFARTLWQSGTARLENKDTAAALAELEEAVAMGEKVLAADHAHLKEYRETLAACRAALAEKGKPDAP